MKIGNLLRLVWNTAIFGLLLIIVVCSGCGSEPKDPFAHVEFNPYSDGFGNRIEAYESTAANNAVTP